MLFPCIFEKDTPSPSSYINGRKTREKTSSSYNADNVRQHDHLKKYEELNQLASRVSSQEGTVDANSEKELVNFAL